MTATARVTIGFAHPMNGWFRRIRAVRKASGEGPLSTQSRPIEE
jgi:hypothetical protein